MFSRQTIWELTINIAQAINNVVKGFGLPPFKMIFSGSRGIHLVYAMDYDTITDIEHHVNLPELSDNTLLPGITSLKKEKISSLNDKFKFAKSLLQSLLLYTVYKGTIAIPPEIRRKLKIIHGQQLFRLAVDSKDLIAVLLDTSSVSKGVFHLFSPHPITRLVSIPISDIKKEGISERYLTYSNVIEDAKIEAVIERFDTDDAELFFQIPHTITRDNIQMLLRPDKLYPSFATLLRFGTTYSMRRTPNSFNFWHHFYELRGVYNYIYKQVLNKNGVEDKKLFVEIGRLLRDLDVGNRDQILDLLRLHLLTDTISFPVFYNCLTTLYYYEFFFNVKSPAFIQENEKFLIELFKNQWEFSNFLKQTGLMVFDTLFSFYIEDYEYKTELYVLLMEILNNFEDLVFFAFSDHEKEEIKKIYQYLECQDIDLSTYRKIDQIPIINLQLGKFESLIEILYSISPEIKISGDALFRNHRLVDQLFYAHKYEEIVVHNQNCLVNEAIILLKRWLK